MTSFTTEHGEVQAQGHFKGNTGSGKKQLKVNWVGSLGIQAELQAG